jgi:hypothetical protein
MELLREAQHRQSLSGRLGWCWGVELRWMELSLRRMEQTQPEERRLQVLPGAQC